MAPPDPDRRRVLLGLAAGLSLLAGCGEFDRRTPGAAPPPTATPRPPGPGPGTPERPPANPTGQRGTGRPATAELVLSKPDGGEVPATLYGGGDCAVVLVPGADRDRQSWAPYAGRLAAAGRLAMAIDEGEDRKVAGVTAAVTYLRRETNVGAVVIVGADAGGAAVVRAAAAGPEAVDGVVALSPTGSADAAPQLSMPTLVVATEDDDPAFVETARTLVDAAPGPATLVSYGGDAHGQALFESTHAADLRERLGTFLSRACEPASTPTGTPPTSTTRPPGTIESSASGRPSRD